MSSSYNYTPKTPKSSEPHNISNVDSSYSETISNKPASSSVLSVILGYLVIFMLGVYILRFNSDPDNIPTLNSFLTMLSNIDTINVNLIFDSLRITADWGIMNFLRDFLNYGIMLPIEIVVFIGGNLINLITYFIYLMTWVLGG